VFSFSSHRTSAAMRRRVSLSLLGTLASLTLASVLSVLPVASAQAATGTCPSSVTSQPFLKWGDSNYYSLVPGGDFEGSLTGWTLSGGAKTATGSESYGVTGKVGKYSLSLPQGASVQSPFMCVTEVNRSFRFFARSEASSSSLRAEVVYQTSSGNVSVTVGSVTAQSGWEPAPILKTGAVIASALNNGTAQMALRFTSVTGSSRIDDVYLDPRMH